MVGKSTCGRAATGKNGIATSPTKPNRQAQAKRLVLNAAPKLRRTRLEDVRRWRAVHRDADAACVVDGDRELGLRAHERHRDAFITDEDGLSFKHCSSSVAFA
jgi:hypothetical protein